MEGKVCFKDAITGEKIYGEIREAKDTESKEGYLECVLYLTRKNAKKLNRLFGMSNNWRKLHGLPMFRVGGLK